MPQTVEIEGQWIAEFPDEMTPDEISGVIQKTFYARPIDTEVPHGTTTEPKNYGPAAAVRTEMDWANKPLLTLPRAEQQKGPIDQITAGIVNAGADLAEGLSTPLNLAMAPLAATKSLGRVVAGIFGGQMLSHVPESIAAADKETTLQGRTRGALGVLSNLFLGIGAGVHATGLRAKLKPVLEPEALAPEAAIPEPVRPLEVPKVEPVAEPPLRPNETISPRAVEGSTADAASTEAAQARLLPGEKQGDLISSTQVEDFKLAGEKTVDGERVVAERAKVEADAVEAKRIQGQQQQKLDITTDAEASAARENYEASLSEDYQQYIKNEAGATELLDAIERAGGLPSRNSPKFQDYKGELERIHETVRDPNRKERMSYNKLFRADSLGSDAVLSALRERGFDVETPSDVFNLVEQRVASGKPIYGQSAKGESLHGDVMSPGPGAASAKEPLASYEQRRFGKRFQADEKIDSAIRDQTGNQYYEPISNKVTVAEAEKLIEDYGTDTSIRLVRDEAVPMQPRVRVTMGQALIKKLNQSHQEAKAAGDVRATEFLEQAVDTAEYVSELGTAYGQGTQAFAIWDKLGPDGMLLEATRIAKKSGTELTPEQVQKIADLTTEIEKTPEGFQQTEKTMELMNFMSEIKGIKPGDIPTALWYSNILSGFSTQLVNTLDTGLNVFAESATMAASHPTAIPQILSGLYRGMIKGGFEAASVLKTGKSITSDKIRQQRVLERVQFGKEGGVPISTETPTGRFLKAAFESKAATPLNLWKYPLRAMVASDTVFFNSMKEARARFLARGIAKQEGLTGDALFERVERELNEGPGRVDAALAQAQTEGLTGLRQRRRVNEIIEQGRTEDLVANATEGAEIATYNHEPSGVLGLVAHNIANITEGFPPGKAIVPFTRIIANVANRGLNFTPWGYKRLFFGEWGGRKFATEPPTGEAYRTQLVKATLGTTAMATVALLDVNDTIQVTAQGPADPNERKQLQNTGWKPYSVKVGNTFYSYQYTPFNLGFAMIGHYRDAIRYNKLSEKDASTRLAYGMMKSGSTIFDMSFLSGVSDFLETVQGATSSTKGAGRLFARTLSSIVVPNLVKQTDKLFDPTAYQGDSITQGLIRETPIARGAMLQPMLNVLGEPIKPSQNRFFGSETKDPVWQLIVEKQAWVPVPSKTTKIKNRPIKPDEYYLLIKESGPRIRQYIQSNLGRFKTMDGEQVQKAIRDESEKIRTSVKSRFR